MEEKLNQCVQNIVAYHVVLVEKGRGPTKEVPIANEEETASASPMYLERR
jgi:hypothetical protein